ncbi:hypothetical protein [Actinocrispum sp. NPDC049592]|uniref:hypothetical protein n=1 Tax=Actinocrispum sp. NPDC049592 TaxID=3154835 RepID=UPI0034305514
MREIAARVAVTAFAASAFSIALGHPVPQQPPEPGFVGTVLAARDYVTPMGLVTCPPPTKTSAATNPTGSDC